MTDSIAIVFLAFFAIDISFVIAFLIFYLEHIRNPLELAKKGKC